MVFKIEVGQHYMPGVTKYPEGCEYNYYDGGHELRIFAKRPDYEQKMAIRKGVPSFGFLIYKDILFLLYQFKPLPWSDAPYSYWTVPEDRRQIPPDLTPTQSAILNTILIDADTGIVEGIRVLTFTPEFSRLLHGALAKQAQSKPLDPQEYNRQVDEAYRVYPDTINMVSDGVIQ